MTEDDDDKSGFAKWSNPADRGCCEISKKKTGGNRRGYHFIDSCTVAGGMLWCPNLNPRPRTGMHPPSPPAGPLGWRSAFSVGFVGVQVWRACGDAFRRWGKWSKGERRDRDEKTGLSCYRSAMLLGRRKV